MFKSILLILLTSVLFTGCGFKFFGSDKVTELDKTIKISDNDKMEKIKEYIGLEDLENTKLDLLKNNPYYSEKNVQEALRVNEDINVKEGMPLYKKPLFAQMIIFPYSTDDGVYHSYQKIFLKVKDGEFVLAPSKKKKVSDLDFFNIKR